MSSFVIYQSEHGVRTENVKLRAELEEVRADANELRRRLGESEVAYAPLVDMSPAAGQSFKAGSCTVQIGRPGAGYMPSPQTAQAPGEVAREAPEVLINGRHVQPGRPSGPPRALPAPPRALPAPAAPMTEADLEAEATGAVTQPVAVAARPTTIQTEGREGQRVLITSGAPPMINPTIARARGIRQAPVQVATAPPEEVAPAQVAARVNPSYVDADDTSVRMSLLEL